jgi:hypothetical protein
VAENDTGYARFLTELPGGEALQPAYGRLHGVEVVDHERRLLGAPRLGLDQRAREPGEELVGQRPIAGSGVPSPPSASPEDSAREPLDSRDLCAAILAPLRLRSGGGGASFG